MKVIFNKLDSLPQNKALLWPELQIGFEVATGQSIKDHLDDVQAASDELEAKGYARFEQLPTGMPRVVRGIHFDQWRNEMKPSAPSNQINISSLNAQNVQVGNENTMNVNITPEEFVDALNRIQQDPEKARSSLSQLNELVKKGLSFGETVAKFISLFG